MTTCLGQRTTFISMMFLTTSFFFVELIVGYATNSMALVADSFHMLSDIVSLFVGYFALKYSRKTSGKTLVFNTFGLVRAEVLGALINAIFLIALCFSILIEALKRLVEPEELKQPLLILGVGGTGLLINLIGMLLFHGHAGGHGHSHGGGGHGHSHGGGGHGHSQDSVEHSDGHGHSHTVVKRNRYKKDISSNDINNPGQHNLCFKEEQSTDDMTISIKSSSAPIEGKVAVQMYINATDDTPSSEIPVERNSENKKNISGQMNMKGVYLHILGDALGSVVVIIAALLVHFFHGEWTKYIDPSLSILLVAIILKTTIPLLKESSKILLQNVPSHIQLNLLEERLLVNFPEIIAVHEFHVWQLTGNKIVASLHVKFTSNVDYRLVSSSLKEFFHEEGIHSTTVQPEFVENESDDEKKCLLQCVSKSCEEKLCCNIEEDKKVENEVIDKESKPSLPKQTIINVEQLKVTAIDNHLVDGGNDITEPHFDDISP